MKHHDVVTTSIPPTAKPALQRSPAENETLVSPESVRHWEVQPLLLEGIPERRSTTAPLAAPIDEAELELLEAEGTSPTPAAGNAVAARHEVAEGDRILHEPTPQRPSDHPTGGKAPRQHEEIELAGGWNRTAVYAVRKDPPYRSRAHQALAQPLPSDAQDPAEVARQLGIHCVEILKGHRPLAHIRSWVDPKVYAVISRRTSLALHLLGKAPKSQAPRARCLSVRWVQPRCVEVVVVVDDRRQHLLAMRLEYLRDRWRVSALEME